MGLVIRFLVLVAAIFTVTVYRVTLKTETENMNRQLARIRRRSRTIDREITHLRIKSETLRGYDHVKLGVKEFNLGLKIPSPWQVRRIGVNDAAPKEPEPGREPVLLSQR